MWEHKNDDEIFFLPRDARKKLTTKFTLLNTRHSKADVFRLTRISLDTSRQ